MKRALFALILILTMVSLCAEEAEYQVGDNLEQAEGCDFRLSRWGDARQKVIDSEIGFLAEWDDEGVYFTGMAFDPTVLVVCQFEDDKLYQGDFIVIEEYNEPQQFVDAFKQIVEKLNQRYGKPAISDVLAGEERYKQDENWVEGLRAQDLVVMNYWETERTLIGCSLKSDDEAIYVVVEYAKQ